MKTSLLVAALLAVLAGPSSVWAQRRPPDQRKVAAGARVVESGPRSNAPSAAPRRQVSYPLRLQLHEPGTPDAPSRMFTAKANEQLVLTLEVWNGGDAGVVELAAVTIGLDVLFPATVEIPPRSTAKVEVRVVKQDCQRRATFLQLAARPRGLDDVRATSLRVGVKCP